MVCTTFLFINQDYFYDKILPFRMKKFKNNDKRIFEII